MERRADPTFSVSTGIQIAADPMIVWERLCDSEMPATAPCEFMLGRPFGMPQPIRCELPDGPGGVGASRRCVSDRGVINQRITEWMPGARLAFELESDGANLNRHVVSMRDVFELGAAQCGTRLVRHTTFHPAGPCPRLRGLALRVALRRVHRFTLNGFKVATECRPQSAT
jgi:hypothetical protein